MRAAALALLVAACGESGIVGEDQGVTANQIERLSRPEVEVVDRQASVRPQPLKAGDLQGGRMPAPGCAFGRAGRMLLAATPNDAIARLGGRLHHLAHSAPMGPSGGFFEDRQLSISVGRTAESGADTGQWPARMTITNRRSDAQIELDGVWRCGS